MRNEAGIFSDEDLKLFLRKKFSTKASHRFVLILDESGSMKGDAQPFALQAMALFQHVMDQLKTKYAVVGFHDTAECHKTFDEEIRSEKALDALMQELESSGGGGNNEIEAFKFSEDLLKGEAAEQKTVIVITDGTGMQEIPEYVKKMEANGIQVIAIGIGMGTESVMSSYPTHYQSQDFRDLPKTLLKILAKQMLSPVAKT
jgi:uncharacterized protein with von Willebrand factor type A (vWA) domain